jgi:hypothetical protein
MLMRRCVKLTYRPNLQKLNKTLMELNLAVDLVQIMFCLINLVAETKTSFFRT